MGLHNHLCLGRAKPARTALVWHQKPRKTSQEGCCGRSGTGRQIAASRAEVTMLKEMRVSRQALPPLEKRSLMEIRTENDSGCVQAHCRSQLLFLHQRVPGALRSLEMQKRKRQESSSSLPRSLLLLGEQWEVARRVGISCAAFYKATGCPETSLHLEPPAQPQAAPGRAGSLPGAEARRGLCLWLHNPQLQEAEWPGSQLSPCLNTQIPPQHAPATVMGLLPQDHQAHPAPITRSQP